MIDEEDPFRPVGHRFIFQATEAKTEEEARKQLEVIFGPERTKRAKLVKGRLRYKGPPARWEPSYSVGFRAYLPKGG